MQIESAKMLAEIYILRMEAAVRANNQESTFAPKFVPFDSTRLPGFEASGTTVPRGRSITE
jgi:hypothetical protein